MRVIFIELVFVNVFVLCELMLVEVECCGV